MAIRIFLSHASSDKPFVLEVKHFLEEGGDFACWLDSFEIAPGQNIVSRINDGLAKCDCVLLFMSREACQSRWVEEEWTAAYYAQTNSGDIRLIPVVLGDCPLPAILQNKKFVDLRANQLEGLRQLRADLLRLRPAPVPVRPQSASLPFFVGREVELAELRQRLTEPGSLVPVIGMPGLGKTYLVREFVRRHGALFEAVYELDCQGKDLAALTGTLAMHIGVRFSGEPEQVAAEQRNYLARKRCLLVLDNVDDDEPGALVPGGRAAVLVTARSGSIPFVVEYPELRLTLLDDRDAIDLLQRVLGPVDEAPARQLTAKLGYLPLAIAVAGGLIKRDVRYTLESLAAELPPLEKLAVGKSNVGSVLGKAIDVLDHRSRSLLAAFAVCAPEGSRLELAAAIVEFTETDALDALQELYSRSLIVELDRKTRQYGIHPLIREAAGPSQEMRGKHAIAVLDQLAHYPKHPAASAHLIEEARQALITAEDDPLLRVSLANRAGHLARDLGYSGYAFEFYGILEEEAIRADRLDWLGVAYGNQALLHKVWGQLEEAMQLHQTEQAICEELGDRQGLQISYGNQASILENWNRLDEAMELHKKQEALCHELGNQAGLQSCYGNQALILRRWGRLEEAMELRHQEEALGQELGDRAALSRCYVNQAILLREQGRLAEAVLLLRKTETICRELGNRPVLANCYWTWGLVARVQPDPRTCRQKLEEALELFADLNMPVEHEQVAEDLKACPPEHTT